MTFNEGFALWYAINLLIWLLALRSLRQECSGLHPNSYEAQDSRFFFSCWGFFGMLPVVVVLCWTLMGVEKLEAKYF